MKFNTLLRKLHPFGWCVVLFLISIESWGQECISGNCVNGYGTYTYADGEQYVGEFKDDLPNGQGTKTYVDGSKYIGEHKDGKKHGQGTYEKDGTKYVGEWGDDLPNGQGTLTFANGSKYIGEHKDGLPNGQGIYTWTDGRKYVGEFKDGKKHGQGTNTYADGSKYVGEWRDGERHGQGTSTYAGGDKYVGEWRDGERHGQGTYIFSNGREDAGIWAEGKYLGTVAETQREEQASITTFVSPITFLEEDKVGYLIISENEDLVSIVDLGNQKWMRKLIYSNEIVEVKFAKGACSKEFSGWHELNDLEDAVLKFETKLTTHYARIKSKKLTDAVKEFKKNNTGFQISFFNGNIWSCFEYKEILNEQSLLVLADSETSTFCGLLSNEPQWRQKFNARGISCDKNMNLERKSFEVVQADLSKGVSKTFKTKLCKCDETYEYYCRLNTTQHFSGYCSAPDKRIFGKTFNDSGSIFEGSYSKDNNYQIGMLEWDNGNKIQGEFGIDSKDYDLPKGLDPDQHIVIGQYLLGTITSRGFFTLNEENHLNLTSYGTKFNTDADQGWTYQGGFFTDDELSGESLITLKNDDYSLTLWLDVAEGDESKIYVEENGRKYVNNIEMETIAEGWDDESKIEATRLGAIISANNDALEKNFKILEKRKSETFSEYSKEAKVIKPLSSEVTRSIQELLTALGYETGKIDGVLGRLTIAAIKSFQKEADLEIIGKPTEDLLISLQTELRRLKLNASKVSTEPVKLPIVSSGTGFYIQKDTIVTNYHVVKNCEYLSTREGSKLTVNTEDKVNDIAILDTQILNENILSLSVNPTLGQIVYSGGFPYSGILDSFNFTLGNISSLLGPGSNISEFQFTAPIQPGNSGGAILNSKGGVVGITKSSADAASFLTETKSVPQNINFGIKVEILKDILKENKIEYEAGDNFWWRSSEEKIAELSKNASLLINCHAPIFLKKTWINKNEK